MEDGKQVLRIDAKGLEATVEFSPNGDVLAISDSAGEIALLEVGSWDVLARTTAKTPVDGDGLRFTPGGEQIVTAHYDSVLRCWDARTLAMIGEMKGHKGPVTSLAIHPDGKSLASTSNDGTVRLWHVSTLTEFGALHMPQVVTFNCCFSADGSQLIVSSRRKGEYGYGLMIWDISKASDTATGTAQAN